MNIWPRGNKALCSIVSEIEVHVFMKCEKSHCAIIVCKCIPKFCDWEWIFVIDMYKCNIHIFVKSFVTNQTKNIFVVIYQGIMLVLM